MPVEQSFMKSLFYGVIPEEMIFPFPSLRPDEVDTTRMILDSVRDFLQREVDSARIDREAVIPDSVLQRMKQLGLFGMNIPQEYGGIGLSNTAYARVMQEVAGVDSSLAVTLGAHQSIGLKGILLFGTEAQKRQYLPSLASGERIAAFALTEPGAGSDAASIQTRAEPVDGGDAYLINGNKIWISNGGLADVFTVFARTAAPQDGQKPRLTAFIVEKRHGVRAGPPEHKLGIRGSNTTALYFEDTRVPAANVLGEVGRGFKVAMEILNNGRLSLAAGCVGGCRRLVQMAVERVQERRAFGRPIGEFGMIKDKIARMLAETYALESMTYLTTGLVDAKVADYSLESAICKVFGSETLWRVVNEALQIAAGIGYMQGYPYERLLRDARINLIFEGTNEILRAFIALAGMQGPGRQLAEVARAMREPIKGFGLLSEFAIQRARSALGRERLNRAHPLLRRETVLFEEYVAQLARQVDKVLRRHGKDIAEMQYTQMRVANMAIDLYGLAAVLARTTRAIERKGEEGARTEVELTAAFADAAQRRMRQVVASFDDNNDELLKDVAVRSYREGGYPLDVL
ncbi:MAG: acyl-CoA dehydrogenase family protein [Myxococcota bacterium]|nr:acyl-CoA dehydrogenase family protein [Myxococcota bacterium]